MGIAMQWTEPWALPSLAVRPWPGGCCLPIQIRERLRRAGVMSDGFGSVLRALRAGTAQEAAASPVLGLFQGVIRVHLLEAQKLAQMDHFLGIRGKSDPYAKVSIGLQHFRSKTIYKNLNPTWNEVFEVRVSLATIDCSG